MRSNKNVIRWCVSFVFADKTAMYFIEKRLIVLFGKVKAKQFRGYQMPWGK